MPSPEPIIRLRRLPQLMLFIALTVWYFGARALAGSAASGLAFRFRLVTVRILLEALFHLFLLVVGYVVLDVIARRSAPLAELIALPRRATDKREWLTGAALGWGMVVMALLPAVLLGRLSSTLSLGTNEFRDGALAVAVVLLTTLTHEIAFRGYPLRCLIGAFGESAAVALMVLGAGLSAWHKVWVPGTAVLASMLLAFLLTTSWLRTRAIWLAWGLHFALVVCGAILFGLPVGGGAGFTSAVRGTLHGADWITGGDFGPTAAPFTLVVLVVAIVVLFRITRDYAWNYTHSPIVAGGYEVAVAPPAAHTAMEQTPKPAALVQILSSTPTGFSAEHAPTAPIVGSPRDPLP